MESGPAFDADRAASALTASLRALGDPGRAAQEKPAAWTRIDGWARDDDFWVRRSALLALLPGIRNGRADLARFGRYAEPMLGEKEFFIRKAIGWVLREMSGVPFREAVRRLPEAHAARLRALRDGL